MCVFGLSDEDLQELADAEIDQVFGDAAEEVVEKYDDYNCMHGICCK